MNNKINLDNLVIDAFTTPEPRCVMSDISIGEAIDIMDDEDIRHLPIQNKEGAVVGILSDRDVASFRRLKNLHQNKVEEIMITDPISVPLGTPLSEAVFLMSENKIGSLVITDNDGGVAGIFTSIDALNALVEVLRGEILSIE